MMRKEKMTYYFSVEGETEKWYLEWLQHLINQTTDARYSVKFDCQIQKDPLKRAKRILAIYKTEIIHVMDRESEEAVHVQRFEYALDRMKTAEKFRKSIKYRLGYCNFSFELWIVLHKAECNGLLSHRRQYLPFLNRAFVEQFENLEQYKQKANFKRILSKLTIDDVCQAIRRSKYIMQTKQEHSPALRQYKGYKYYTENPSLSVWEIIEIILKDCGLI